MKNLFLLFLSITALDLFAQGDETIFSHVNRIGGFGAPIFEFSPIKNNDDINSTVGGGGGIILGDFFFGGYGIGDFEFSRRNDGLNRREAIDFNHRGFWLGYTPAQHKAVHPYLSLRLGWGDIDFKAVEINDPSQVIINQPNADNIFVLTPEIGFELNIFHFFRLAATGSYRYVSGVSKLEGYDNNDFSAFGGVLTLRFGGFGNHWW